MFGLNDLGRVLVVVGLVIVAAGLLLTFAGRVPWLGRLPGDIYIRRGDFVFYFPLATSVLLSLILSLIFRLLSRR